MPYYSSVTGLDPIRDFRFSSSVVIMDLIYSPLYKEQDDPSNILASVGTDDSRVWFFTLKPGLRFQDDPCFKQGRGREINAHDVRRAFLRARIYYSLVDLRPVENIKEIRVLDSLHLKLELYKPDPSFIKLLSSYRIRVIPQEALDRYGENIRFHPTSSGPFKLASWNEQEITLLRNENFWVTPLPYLDKIILYPSKNPLASFNEFLKGNLDASPIPSQLSQEIVQYNRKNKKFQLTPEYTKKGWKIISGNRLSLSYCDFFTISDSLVRQALNFAINREKIISRQANLFPATSPLFKPYSRGFNYDPEKARNLLVRAGYKEGKGLKKPFILAAGSSAMSIASIIRENLQEIGIQIEVKPTSWFGFQRKGRDMGIAAFSSLGHEIDSQLGIYRKPTFLRPNDTISNLSHRLINEKSEEKRELLARQLEKEILKDPPLIYLFWRKKLLLVKSYVMNADGDRWGVSARLWLKR